MVHTQTLAAIDIGTNSILLLIAKRTSSPVPTIVPLQTHVKNHWKQLPTIAQTSTVLLTGGTAPTLAALAQQLTVYDISAIDGYRMTSQAIEELYDRLNQLSVIERADLPGMEPGRADIILPALILLLTLLKHFSINAVQISVRGARMVFCCS